MSHLGRHLPRAMVTIAPLAAAWLVGCATGRITWEKPGIEQAERERDENACLRAAIGTGDGGGLLVPYCIDREVYTRCMEKQAHRPAQVRAVLAVCLLAVVEGVNLVANYRTQFDSVLRTASYEELLARMRSRAEETRP